VAPQCEHRADGGSPEDINDAPTGRQYPIMGDHEQNRELFECSCPERIAALVVHGSATARRR
jgi:hypothetical protein